MLGTGHVLVPASLCELRRTRLVTTEEDEQTPQAASLQRSLQDAWRHKPWVRWMPAAWEVRRATRAAQQESEGAGQAVMEASNHQRTNRSIININRLATRKLAETQCTLITTTLQQTRLLRLRADGFRS